MSNTLAKYILKVMRTELNLPNENALQVAGRKCIQKDHNIGNEENW